MFVFILITCLLDIVLMLWGEILLWSQVFYHLEKDALYEILKYFCYMWMCRCVIKNSCSVNN